MSQFFAACPIGLEYLLVDELKAMGAADAHEARAGVHFSGELKLAYRAIIFSRLASRVSMTLAEGPIGNDEDLYQLATSVDWCKHLPERSTLDIASSTRHPQLKDSRYVSQRVRDAISDRMRASGRRRPELDHKQHDIKLIVFCSRSDASVSVDLYGGNLSRRGYRTEAGEAPLREDLACAVLMRAGWPAMAEQGKTLADPMCGSGTLVIEAALMAGGVAPGLGRSELTSRWSGHDAGQWQALVQEARERAAAGLAKLSPRFMGTDVDGSAIAVARSNAGRAGVAEFVRFERCELRYWKRPAWLADHGLVVTNPPYGERMGDTDRLYDLYRILGERLKTNWAGWHASVLSSDPELAHAIAMRPERRYKLRNGPIHCVLVNFGAVRGQSEAESDGESGGERPLGPGAEMLANRLKKNLKKIRKYLNKNNITCYRAYDADLPEYNFAIDVYQDHLHVQEYQAPADIPVATTRRRRSEAVRVAAEEFGFAADAITVKTRQRQRGSEQYEKRSQVGEYFTVQEGGLKFRVNLEGYLDSGLFLDHRETRAMIRDQVQGKRFLNLYCYTGSVTVYAAAGGAASTTSVDLSNTYLDWARQNLELNGLSGDNHRFVRDDCLSWLAEDDGQYDLIFVDPPTFSNSKRMDGDFDVQTHHVSLLKACLARLADGGEILFSNNFRKFVLDTESLEGCDIKEITQQTVPLDFSRSRPHRCWLIAPGE
jgi:23S rRNA (guanine2445-N2)-methyltransferase / 23S rRNA (guanine2069-N7)-methyltransferase